PPTPIARCLRPIAWKKSSRCARSEPSATITLCVSRISSFRFWRINPCGCVPRPRSASNSAWTALPTCASKTSTSTSKKFPKGRIPRCVGRAPLSNSAPLPHALPCQDRITPGGNFTLDKNRSRSIPPMPFVDNVLGYGRWWNRLSNRILMSRENGLDANSLEFQSNAPLLRSSCFKNFRAGRQHQHPDTYQKPNTQKRQHRENGNTGKTATPGKRQHRENGNTGKTATPRNYNTSATSIKF